MAPVTGNIQIIRIFMTEEKSQKDQVVTASKPSKPLLTNCYESSPAFGSPIYINQMLLKASIIFCDGCGMHSHFRVQPNYSV